MENKTRCSFCGRSSEEVGLMFPAPDGKAFICPLCIDMCSQLLDEYNEEFLEDSQDTSSALTMPSLPTPKEIKENLDLYVIGQDKAKIALSVAVYNHYKRLIYNDKAIEEQDVEIQK